MFYLVRRSIRFLRGGSGGAAAASVSPWSSGCEPGLSGCSSSPTFSPPASRPSSTLSSCQADEKIETNGGAAGEAGKGSSRRRTGESTVHQRQPIRFPGGSSGSPLHRDRARGGIGHISARSAPREINDPGVSRVTAITRGV